MTSVKDFHVEATPSRDQLGRGRFEFTDDYSVFDWGKMPDTIPEKGKTLCTMGAFNFELLEAAGVPTHYLGVVPDDATETGDTGRNVTSFEAADQDVTSLEAALEAGTPPRTMAIELTQVPDLPFDDGTYDYDAYFAEAGENYLVPLEIVFRNRVPVGSSLRGRTTPEEFGLGFDDWPDEPVDLPEPVVEFSTKYEEQDRYLSRDEAADIAGPASIDELEALAREVNRLVTDQATETGFVHQDGKIECLYYDGEIRVADVVGTFDENRFSYDGQQVSKEVIRQYHKRTQPAWVEAVSEAKARANREGIADWKSLCEKQPESLDDAVISVSRDLYCAGANAYLGRTVFEAPPIESAVQAAREL